MRNATETALAEQRTATEASEAAHREQMAERERALTAEMTVQRVAQVERISTLLLNLVDVARDEQLRPPEPLDEGSPFRATAIPAILVRLQSAVLILESLGGPRLLRPSRSRPGYGGGSNAMAIASAGIDAFR